MKRITASRVTLENTLFSNNFSHITFAIAEFLNSMALLERIGLLALGETLKEIAISILMAIYHISILSY